MAQPDRSTPSARTAACLGLAVVLTALCGCTGAPGPASRAESAAAGPTVAGDVGRRVDAFLTAMSGFGYSGNVLLVVDGAVVLRKGYGEADRVRHVPYTPDTVFDIGSMAKTFTAAAVMTLERAGRLGLQDAIGKFLPGVPADKQAITVHQLLTHTAGIIADFPFTDPAVQYEDVGRDEAVRRVLAAPLDYPPGTDRAYSNGGYILLAAVVESASGRPFCDYLHEAVFAPAGLRDTRFWGDPRLARSRVALGHDEYGAVQHDPITRSRTTWQDLGGGQIVSTLDDLAAWQRALADGRVLPDAAVARMWTPWTTELSPRDGDYGYGWFVQTTPRGTTLVQHGGDYLGTGAELQWYRDDRVLMITSTNVRHDLFPTRNRTDRVIPKIVFGGEHPQPPAWVADEALLRAAAGRYRLATGGMLTVHERGGRFFVGADGQDGVDLLMPATESVRKRRADLTEISQRAFDGLRTGDTTALTAAAGGASANPEFVGAVQQEVAGLGQGSWRAADVLGTFPSGYPRGNPLDYDTTLVRLRYEHGESPYAIRWANGVIAATEVPGFGLAADTQVQADTQGGLVTWHIVFNVGTTMTVARDGAHVVSLTVRSADGDVVATREGE